MTNTDMPAMPVDGTLRGLSKREELAARNMAAILCANPPHDVPDEDMIGYMGAVADYALIAADALLAELDKEAT